MKVVCAMVLDLACLLITAVSDRWTVAVMFLSQLFSEQLSLFIASLPAALAIRVGDVLAVFESQRKRVMIRCSQLKTSICFTGAFVLYPELKLKFHSIKAKQSQVGKIVAFWKAYLNIALRGHISSTLRNQGFCDVRRPRGERDRLNVEVLLVNMLRVLQKYSWSGWDYVKS